MCLGGEILEKERVHRTLEPDMELVDLALGQGEQLYPGKGQMLVEGGDILLVTRETIQRLGDDDVEGASASILVVLIRLAMIRILLRRLAANRSK